MCYYVQTVNSLTGEEAELRVLEDIHRRAAAVRQRDLAHVVGLSVGMTNAIVRRLAGKGWLQIRKVNNRNVQYIVSPKGLERLARRSYRYLILKIFQDETNCDILESWQDHERPTRRWWRRLNWS